MSVYANEGFYALAGFAKVVGAIDGSSVPIITPINVSVHPPHETVDRVNPPPRHRASRAISLRSFFFCFVAFGQSVHFIFNSNSDALLSAIIPNDNVDYVKAKLSEISSDTHQLYYTQSTTL